jgi:hypothetical protein
MLDPTSSPRERKELNSSRSVYFHADLVSPSSDDIVNTAYNKPNADRDNRDNDSDHGKNNPSLLSSFLVYILILLILIENLTSAILPSHPTVDLDFDVNKARNNLIELTSIGSKIIGSDENEIIAPNILLWQLNDIKRAAHPDYINIEIELQHVSGQFYESFLGGINNVYSELTNVVVRVSWPSNPFFNNSTGFSLTRNLISRHRERIAKANAVKEEAFYHSMHNAALETASQLTGLDTSLEQQLNEFIAPPPARESPSHAHNNSTRPKSGMFGKTQPAVPALTTGARPNSAGRLRLRTQTATGGATTKAPFLNTTNHVNMLTTNNNTNNGSQSVVSGNTVSRPTSPETVQGMSTASMLSLSRREQAQKTVDDLQLNSEMSAELQRIRQELSKLQQQRHYEKVRSLVVVVYLSHG